MHPTLLLPRPLSCSLHKQRDRSCSARGPFWLQDDARCGAGPAWQQDAPVLALVWGVSAGIFHPHSPLLALWVRSSPGLCPCWGLPSPCPGWLAPGGDAARGLFGLCRGRAGPTPDFQGEEVTPSHAPDPRGWRCFSQERPLCSHLAALHFPCRNSQSGFNSQSRGIHSKLSWTLPAGGCALSRAHPLSPRLPRSSPSLLLPRCELIPIS